MPNKTSPKKPERKNELDVLAIDELERLKTAAELDKLRIEISDLENRNKYSESFLRYSPLITVLIAVAGFLVGIYQFRAQQTEQQSKTIAEQQRALSIRIQDQIRGDVDELLHFTNRKEQTVSRVLFLLNELKYLLHYRISETQTMSDVLPQQEDVLTQSLVGLIDNDCDFIRQVRDVNFTATIVDNWSCYSHYLEVHADQLEELLQKYEDALRSLYDEDPEYFEKMYVSDDCRFVTPSQNPDLFQKFVGLKYGFIQHLAMLGQEDNLRNHHVIAFEMALQNPLLTKQLLCRNCADIPDCGK